jgi:hypothetical protein
MTRFVFLFLLLASFPARASSPGMVEGPPGCSWHATVSVSGATNVAVELQTIRATCMYAPGPCGKEGEIYTIAVTDTRLGITQGETIKVWVDIGADGKPRASLNHPPCTKTPVNPE